MEDCSDPGCFNSIAGWTITDLVDFIVGLTLLFIFYNLIFGNFVEKRIKKRLNKDNISTQKKNNTTTFQKISEIEALQQKIDDLNEEEKIKDLKELLNQKRIERGLLSLFDFEELENKIDDFKKTYERKKRSRNYVQEKYSYLKPRRNIGTAIFCVPAVYSFYSVTNTGIPALVTGTIFWVIGASYFYYLNKKIKFFNNKTEILSSEIKDLETEIDKNSRILDKNKL